MVLVIGGLSSGKRDFVKNEYGYTESDISSDVFSATPVLFDLQELINTDSDSERFFPSCLKRKS